MHKRIAKMTQQDELLKGKWGSMTQKTLSVGIVAATFVASVLFVPLASAAQSNASGAAKSAAADKAAKLAERAANYKTKQALVLTAADTTKLKGSCKAAQAKVSALSIKVGATYTARTKLFTNITTKITALKSGLTDADVDTKDLETAELTFTKAVTDFKTAHESFQINLSDISEMDCVTDPTAFKAAVLTARADRQSIADKAKAVVDAVPAIKAALVAARKALAATSSATQTTETTTTTNTGGIQ